MADSIDWSAHDALSQNTVTCDCWHVFRSHSKLLMDPIKLVSREPCPACGGHDLRGARSDPEHFTLG